MFLLTGVVLACNLSTSQVCLKKTPHTVGVPAWAKAGQRRLKDLMKMEKPKSEKQIQAEFNLANDPTELNLYTTSRTGSPPEYNSTYDSQIEKYDLLFNNFVNGIACTIELWMHAGGC